MNVVDELMAKSWVAVPCHLCGKPFYIRRAIVYGDGVAPQNCARCRCNVLGHPTAVNWKRPAAK
jgi:hypothetical protein